MENRGVLTQVIGPVVDILFKDNLPKIYNALKVQNGDKELVLEVAQHIGNNMVRTIAMDDTSIIHCYCSYHIIPNVLGNFKN